MFQIIYILADQMTHEMDDVTSVGSTAFVKKTWNKGVPWGYRL